MGEVLSAHGKEMSEIKSNLAAVSTQMAAMMEEIKKNRVSGYRTPSRSPSPQKGGQTGMLTWNISSGSAQVWDRRRGKTSVFS